MTTPRDLLIVALERGPGAAVEQGDLSLALAGAELIDLLSAGVVHLDGESLVPGAPADLADPLLDQAAASLPQQPPYESVEDWLWRRGRDLATAYLTSFAADGHLVREPRRLPFRPAHTVLSDSPSRRFAAARHAAHEPILAALTLAAGIDEPPPDEPPPTPDEPAATVLATLTDALTELAFIRHRRSIEQAAFDNIWRGPAG